MTNKLTHRGPDSDGFLRTDRAILGFRRLKIIDLSTGDQPIGNEDGSLQVVFNGEIYNFQEIRRDLQSRGHIFHTQTDTEAIVHAYEEYGSDCVRYFRGMFAFALWDEKQQRLFIARDRVGKKPLYYYYQNNELIFASELKALLQHPHVPREIDPAAIDQYLHLGYIPGEGTILHGVNKLLPGHWLAYHVQSQHLEINKYWKLKYLPKLSLSFQDAAYELRRLLSEAVRLRMISDMPIGVMLSGGIDSCVVVGLMAERSSQPIKTFTIGFPEEKFNELSYALQVARRFSTDHHELVIRPRAAELLADLVWYLDEPMADASVLPTYYLAQMARQEVTVALNGDGGDELFAGYRSYAAVLSYQRYAALPGWLRIRMIESALAFMPGSTQGDHFLARARRAVCQSKQPLEQQFMRWMTLYDRRSLQSLYTDEFAYRAGKADGLASRFLQEVSSDLGLIDWMLCHDTLNYLPGDLLVKMDRMTMAHSLEGRSPLLDQEVMEFVAQLPEDYKHRNGVSKHILKFACADLLPSAIKKRHKHGFSVPVDIWLRRELKPIATDLLFGGSFRRREIFNHDQISRLWQEHQDGTENHGHRIWGLMILEMWQQQFLDISPA